MAVNVTIRYPEPSEAISSESLDLLRTFEPALCANMVKVMCSTSNYRWEHASHLKSDLYFTLVKTYDEHEVITIGLRELVGLKPEELLERIRLGELFPEKRLPKPTQ